MLTLRERRSRESKSMSGRESRAFTCREAELVRDLLRIGNVFRGDHDASRGLFSIVSGVVDTVDREAATGMKMSSSRTL